MQFLKLKNKLKNFTVFSITDLKKIDKSIYSSRLVEWQDKGYIKKIIKGHYILSDLDIDESVLFIIANKIYKPSYISFEMALSYYNLIPESIFGITSATTRHTYDFSTYLGKFSYRKIKPKLMFGYKLVKHKNRFFKIAEIEKAIMDFFYIKPYLKSEEDFEELRIDSKNFFEQINLEKLNKYLHMVGSQVLARRIRKLVRVLRKKRCLI